MDLWVSSMVLICWSVKTGPLSNSSVSREFLLVGLASAANSSCSLAFCIGESCLIIVTNSSNGIFTFTSITKYKISIHFAIVGGQWRLTDTALGRWGILFRPTITADEITNKCRLFILSPGSARPPELLLGLANCRMYLSPPRLPKAAVGCSAFLSVYAN